jgi:transcriptional regulator with XRE-family HTH domain
MGDRVNDVATGFGSRLKELREKAGLSQAHLAEKAGMNVFGVAKLEQGQREPSWATVQSLCKALGVECAAFADCNGTRDEGVAEKAAPKKPAPKKGKK